MNKTVLIISMLVLGFYCSNVIAEKKHPGQDELVARIVATGQYNKAEVEEILGAAVYKQKILDIYTRTAESKPWYTYRPIFMTDQRVSEGLEFWNDNQKAISDAAEKSGVDEEIIVAVIGVETYYGRILGNYRVLDALMTLAFYHPTRKTFFSKELVEYLLLSQEEHLALYEIKGSYAGAMGLGQFMPSSYRAYALDGDGDGRRDLWGSRIDAIASVANYFNAHHWRKGELIALPAQPTATAAPKKKSKMGKPASTVAAYQAEGYSAVGEVAGNTAANLIVLEQKTGNDYWLTFHNFYVITRYNRSRMYAMVVKQLSEKLRAGRDASL
ncbi:MAG: lytic murein transglycosylase B [Xanthomonadales bacterium]|nr:lytic murein transglycosylase B [Xanthomonadales bacterium]